MVFYATNRHKSLSSHRALLRLYNNIHIVEIGHFRTKRQPREICHYVISMQYDLTPSCMWTTRDVTAKICRHRRILWVSEQLCTVSRLKQGILHFYYAFLFNKYTMYNIPEMTWVPITRTLRACKSNEDQARADAVARKLGTKKYKEFWSPAHSMSNSKVPLPSSIDNTTGETEIAKSWHNHYCNLLNSVKNDRHKNLVLEHISQVYFQDNMVVTASEVEAVIRSLSPGKAAGIDGLTSEHL